MTMGVLGEAVIYFFIETPDYGGSSPQRRKYFEFNALSTWQDA